MLLRRWRRGILGLLCLSLWAAAQPPAVSPDRADDVPEPVRRAEEALRLAESAGDAWEAVQARISLGSALADLGDGGRALLVLREALEALEKWEAAPGGIPRHRILESRLEAAGLSGRILMAKQDNASAAAAFARALDAAKELGDDRSAADALFRTALCRLLLTQYTEAMAAGIEALEISGKIGDKGLMAQSEYAIGYLHRDLGNLDLSREYFQASLEHAREAGDHRRAALALNEIGNVLVLQKRFDEALEIKKQALKAAESIGDSYIISCCLHDIGNLFLQNNDPRQALPYFLRAFDYDLEAGGAREIAISSQNIAAILLDENEDARALAYLERALDSIEKADFPKERLGLYNTLSAVTARMGQTGRALEFLRKAYDLRDRILKEESSRELQEIQTRYETEKKTRENEILRQDNAIKEIALRQQKTVRHSLIALSALVVILALVIANRYRLKTRSHRELERAHRKIRDQNEKLAAAAARLEDLSREDPLTGLANRRGMMEAFREEQARYERHRRPFALIMIDIDDFKAVNDAYGHDGGDFVLKTVADVLRGSLRKTSRISRWGGDEFLILLPETGPDGALAATRNIKSRMTKTPLSWKDAALAVRISMGFGVYRDGLEIDDCLREADQRMYRRKRAAKTAKRS